MMPPNYCGKEPKLYLSNGTSLVEFDHIPTLTLTADETETVYRPFENTSVEISLKLPLPFRVCGWNRLLGWRRRTVLRPRRRQRMKAWDMIITEKLKGTERRESE